MPPFQPSRNVGNQDYTRSTVVIIGAGISGLCTAIDLLRRTPCRNFLILEKGSQVGGTWHDNKYPGCACDVWSALYSYSFEQKSDWSREYPGQEELLTYLIHVAEKYGLYKYIRFNSTVKEARWDDAALQWKVDVAVSGEKDSQFQPSYQLATDFLVSAVGQLNVPSWPDIAGLHDFGGKLMHSARWDWSYDFAGKKVAVIGNGATAVQIVPELAKSASSLTVHQRTPNWVIPRMDMSISPVQQFVLGYVAPIRWTKRAIMMRLREASHSAITNSESAFSQHIRKIALATMKKQMRDKPELWETLTPNYSPGCKRVIPSDDYYVALNRQNVHLETRRIGRVTDAGIETADGAHEDYDLIVLATGFRSVEFMHPIRVFGKGGRAVSDIWKDGAAAFRGVTVEDLPNFAMLYGPNTNLGHNSIILMIESQSRYISSMVNELVAAKTKGETLAVHPKAIAVHDFNTALQHELGQSSFADPNCMSWYKQEDGRITNNWPGTVLRYQRELDKVRWDEYEIEGSGKDRLDAKKSSYVGRAVEEMPVGYATMLLGAVAVAGGYYLAGGRALRRRR